jgi:HlyD family secretion protein
MNVEGVITLDKAENVLAVPVDALQRGNQVYVKDTAKESSENTNKAPVSSDSTAKTGEKQSASGLIPDGFHAVTVETGVTSDEYVEITSGDLSEGDTVYITQSTVTTNEDINMPGMNGGPDGGFGGAPGGNFSGNRSGSGAPSGGPMRN